MKNLTIRGITVSLTLCMLAGTLTLAACKKNAPSADETAAVLTAADETEKAADTTAETVCTPREAFDLFANNHHLTVFQDEEVFDMDGLESDHCITAARAFTDESADPYYSIEILEFTGKAAAEKEYEAKKKYQENLEAYSVVEVHSAETLSKKHTADYDYLETKNITDDLYSNDIMFHYAYQIRIENYYINLFSIWDYDMTNYMIPLKNEFNAFLNIE